MLITEFYNLLKKNQVLEQYEEIKVYLTDSKYTITIFGPNEYTTESKKFKFEIFVDQNKSNLKAIHICSNFPRKASILTYHEPKEAFLKMNGWFKLGLNLKKLN